MPSVPVHRAPSRHRDAAPSLRQFNRRPKNVVQRKFRVSDDPMAALDPVHPNSVWSPYQYPLLWQGSAVDAPRNCKEFGSLGSMMKLLLLSDGSLTKHLSILTGADITAECCQMQEMDKSALKHAPASVDVLGSVVTQRQVTLQNTGPHAPPLVYAASWWDKEEVGRLLGDVSKPIGTVLKQEKAELFRDQLTVCRAHSPQLEAMFGFWGPFWGRDFVFWTGGRPIAVVHECFSPVLTQYFEPDAYVGEGEREPSRQLHLV